MLFRVVSGAFTDLVSNPAWRFYPDFVSLSAGDLNGDGDDEVMLLRDPVEPRVSLLMVNPVGVAMNAFEQVTGAGSAAFKIVRTGDMDGDGRDEIVILKGDRYRIYTEPNVDSRAMETLGSYYAPGTVSNLPFMALANVDGGGQPFGPILGVPPTSLSFDLEHNQPSPTKIVSITNLGTSDVLDWQAEVIVGAPWLLLNSTSGTTSGTLSISVDTTPIGPGSYTGKIRISATGGGGPVQGLPQEVTVNVTSNDGATTTFTRTSGYGEIRGVVWLDRNGDQLVDVSEPGLTDVQVCLLQEDFQIRTAITGANGEYRFTMLTPGRYQVSEVQPADLRFSSTPNQGVIDLAADETSVVNFGDWNGRSTYPPLILR